MKTGKRYYLVVLLINLFLFSEAQVYRADWNSLDQRPVPDWYKAAKFGIFIHWGIYSVPSWAPTNVSVYAKYAEWYWMRSTDKKAEGYEQFRAFHKKAFGDEVQYPDFARDFTATMFDPDQWADIFVKAGAKYVVLTSKHHDGFALWPSAESWNWNSMNLGPHRDLLGDLTNSVKNKGLHMGYYYSLYEWFNPLYKNNIRKYVDEHMTIQMKDLVTSYKPDILWTDGEWDHSDKVWKSEEFLAWLYNESPVKDRIVVNDRWGRETRSRHGGVYTTEYNLVEGDKEGIGSAAKHPWEEIRGIGGSFGYNRNERLKDYSSSEELIHLLIRTVSNGGNLLLDVGPTADGRIPVIMEQRLTDMGNWLKINGEAIYATESWWNNPNGTDSLLYFTKNGKILYAIATAWPGKEMAIKGLATGRQQKVELLGSNRHIEARNKNGILYIKTPLITPGELPVPYAYVFKIYDALP
jgi:alpha-L-fucosidase